jgi:RNA polymerase sigma factor (sigma-70 family)
MRPVTETTLTMLRQVLLQRYGEIKQRLARRLGSEELAGDAIQDAWVKLARAQTVGVVRNPGHYLFSVALNAARNRLMKERRYLSASHIEGLLDTADDAPDPAEAAEGRSELRWLKSVMMELSERQREILLAACIDEMPRREIAERLGISLRLVEKELHVAQAYCLARMTELSK